MTQTIERRVFDAELRVERREGEPAKITGHAAVFNLLSEDLGGFRERVTPGCFTDTISTDDIRALFNHDPSIVLGRNRAGTLKLREDERGLAFDIELPDTQAGRDLVTSIERGDVSGNSFGFRTLTDEWAMEDGESVRTLVKVRLFDVSPATFPAYPQTDLALRSLEVWRDGAKAAPKVNAWRRRLALLDS